MSRYDVRHTPRVPWQATSFVRGHDDTGNDRGEASRLRCVTRAASCTTVAAAVVCRGARPGEPAVQHGERTAVPRNRGARLGELSVLRRRPRPDSTDTDLDGLLAEVWSPDHELPGRFEYDTSARMTGWVDGSAVRYEYVYDDPDRCESHGSTNGDLARR